MYILYINTAEIQLQAIKTKSYRSECCLKWRIRVPIHIGEIQPMDLPKHVKSILVLEGLQICVLNIGLSEKELCKCKIYFV
jgi:hypothetical protein